MADTFRALCAELLNGLVEQQHPDYPWPGYTLAAMDRARALLAEPVAEGPTDEELERAYEGACHPAWERGEFYGAHLDGLRAVLARWGHPAAAPVPEPGRFPNEP